MSGPVTDWRTLPRESYWIYRVRVFRGSPTDSGEIWLTRLYVRRSAAEVMRAKYSERGYRVTVEVSAFAPAFVPVAELDACSTPTRRRLPVVEGVT